MIYRSRVDFRCGSVGDYASDIAFHFSLRFDKNVTARNSRNNCSWVREESTGEFPLNLGEDFEISILCKMTHYEVRHTKKSSLL